MTPTSRRKAMDVSDEALLASVARNDKAALNELYQRYRQPLGAFLNRRLFDKKLADEVFNDVMFTIWQKASGFRGDSKASTWIFGIAYRVVLSSARKEAKHTSKRDDLVPEQIEQHLASEPEQDNPMIDYLSDAIQGLSEKHKTVIELAYFHEQSLDQIALIVKVPVNTVKTRLFHARQYLKKTLEAEHRV